MTEIDHTSRFAAAISYRADDDTGIGRQKRAIEAAIAQGLRPDEMMAQVERHRVAALALDTLARTGMEDALGNRIQDLRDLASAQRRNGLTLAMRGRQARMRLERADIACIEFKGGSALSQKLYGDIALRHSRDVDFMVPADRLGDALEALAQDGWVSNLHPVWTSTPHHRRLARLFLKDIPVLDPNTNCLLELHTRFEPIPVERMESLWWDAMRLANGPDLTGAEFLFLVSHGTKHRWQRMKWLGDIAAIAERHPVLVENSVPLARSLGLEKALALADTLLRGLYDLPLHPLFRPLPLRDSWAVRICLNELRSPEELARSPVARVTDHVHKTHLHRFVFGHRVSFANRTAFQLHRLFAPQLDIEAFGPRPWIALLVVLPFYRIGRLLARYARHYTRLIMGKPSQ